MRTYNFFDRDTKSFRRDLRVGFSESFITKQQIERFLTEAGTKYPAYIQHRRRLYAIVILSVFLLVTAVILNSTVHFKSWGVSFAFSFAVFTTPLVVCWILAWCFSGSDKFTDFLHAENLKMVEEAMWVFHYEEEYSQLHLFISNDLEGNAIFPCKNFGK